MRSGAVHGSWEKWEGPEGTSCSPEWIFTPLPKLGLTLSPLGAPGLVLEEVKAGPPSWVAQWLGVDEKGALWAVLSWAECSTNVSSAPLL